MNVTQQALDIDGPESALRTARIRAAAVIGVAAIATLILAGCNATGSSTDNGGTTSAKGSRSLAVGAPACAYPVVKVHLDQSATTLRAGLANKIGGTATLDDRGNTVDSVQLVVAPSGSQPSFNNFSASPEKLTTANLVLAGAGTPFELTLPAQSAGSYPLVAVVHYQATCHPGESTESWATVPLRTIPVG
jgi:hypothetical protein